VLDAFVLDLDTRGGLAIARALGRQGLRVAVGSRDAHAPGMSTRFAAGRAALPAPEEDFAAYADAIVAFVRDNPAGAILPSIDASVAALHRRRVELGGHAAPAIGAVDAVETAISKPRTLEVARALGIETPRSLDVRTQDDVEAAAGELGLPVVVKPEESWRDEDRGGARLGPAYAASDDDLRAARLLAPALVQEVVPGVRETIKLFRADGRVIARFAMRVVRTWPPLGGSSVVRESIAPPADALARAERLVAEIGLDGYSEVEFRRAADGTPILMEVNPRLSQSVELAVRAGIDFPRMQLEWARGGRIPAVDGYRTGVRLGWLAGDGRLVAAALGKGPEPRPSAGPSVRAVARDYVLRRTRIEGLDLDDPRPILGALAYAARAAARRRGTRRPSASRAR
jgi:predicted ATP-grasp superfamily ATP-dependent carboligase